MGDRPRRRFHQADIALLEQIRPALAAVLASVAILRTARGLFSIYIDRRVGERVLDGQIKRGHTEPLRTVIMATDLRNFTSLSDRLPSEQVIGILDDYFEIVASSVHAHDGNVLKFIGDGVLAVFGADGAQDQTAARGALRRHAKSLRDWPLTSSAAASAPGSDFTSVRSCTAMSGQPIAWTSPSSARPSILLSDLKR